MNIRFESIKKNPRLVTLLLFIFVVSYLQAQSSSKEVDSLNSLATLRYASNPEEAIQIATRALESNKRSPYLKGTFDSYLNLGMAYAQLRRYDSAISYLRRAESFFSGEVEAALIKYYLGVSYCNLEGYITARQFFRESLDIFESKGKLAERADPIRGLGFVAMQQEKYDSALTYFFEAKGFKDREGIPVDPELELISICYERLGLMVEAISYARKSVQSSVNSRAENKRIVRGYRRVAVLYMAQSDLDSAWWAYESGLSVGGSPLNEHTVQCVIGLAEIQRLRNEIKAGIRLIRDADMNSSSASPEVRFLLARMLGDLYLSAGNKDSASYFAQVAFDIAEASSFNNKASQALDILIEASQSIENSARRLALYKMQNRLFRSMYDSAVDLRNNDWAQRLLLFDLVNEHAISRHQNEIFVLRQEKFALGLLSLLGVGTIILLLVLYWYRNQLAKGKKENNGIRKFMQKAQEDLYKQTLHMMHMNNCLEEVEQQVKMLMASNPDQKLSKILKSIRMNKSMDRDWENFNSYFGNVNTGFYEKLSEYSEKLSNHDRRVCALIKLNLTNREIATILNIEVKSVSMIKYRIKKKLGLADEVELSHFITQL